MSQRLDSPVRPAKRTSGSVLLRVGLAGFGLAALGTAGSGLVAAWNHSLARLVLVAMIAVPFLALGALLLVLGVAGEIREVGNPRAGVGAGAHGSATVQPEVHEPENRLEMFIRLLLYAWIGVCLLVFARCLVSALQTGAPTVPLWGWALPLSAIPVSSWMRFRGRFLRRWGRCQLRLLQPAERGKPFIGFIETTTRFEPTRDFQFHLTYHYRDSEGEWPPEWSADQIVGRDRMQPTESGCRIPFHFASLHDATDAPETRSCRRWRLDFRAELDGQPYTESFTGAVPSARSESSLKANSRP